MSCLSDAVKPLGETKSRISLQFTLHVIVMNKSGYPNFLQIAIAFWLLLNIYLVPPVKETGNTMRFPMEDGSISPILTAFCNPLRMSQRINFLFALMNDKRCASIIV